MRRKWQAWIQEHIDPVDVFGVYTRLRRVGRRWAGLCPMHPERTPSFYVFPDTGSCYCFGCRQGGDVIWFLQVVEHLDFAGAIRLLQDRFGLPAPPRELLPQTEQRVVTLIDALALAHRYYQEQLFTPAAAHARAYLLSRGIPEDRWTDFGFGYAPSDGDALLRAMQSGQVPNWVIPQCGLFFEHDGTFRDLFRDRLILPIHDAAGRVIALAGRALGDATPKYLNSQDSPIFRKSAAFFGLRWAAPAIRQHRTVFLVEGYFDAVLMALHGWTHTLAIMGTALTDPHIQWLRRHVETVYVCLDRDEAGLNAAWSILGSLFRGGFWPRFVVVPVGKDPADVFEQADVATMRRAIDQALEWVDFMLVYLGARVRGLEIFADLRRETLVPVALQALSERKHLYGVFQQIAALPDRTMQYLATLQLGQALRIDPPKQLYADFLRWIRRNRKSVATPPEPVEATVETRLLPPYEKWIIATLIEHPERFEELMRDVGESILDSAESRQILRFLYDTWYRTQSVTWADLLETFPDPPERDWIHTLMREDLHPTPEEFQDAVHLLRSRHYRRLRQEIIRGATQMTEVLPQVIQLVRELLATEEAAGLGIRW